MTDLQMALSVDEYHPFVHAYEGGTVVHAPADTIERWRRVMAEWEDVQAEMLAAFTEARRRDEEDNRVKAAELAVAQAQAQLDAITWEAKNPASSHTSWTALNGDDSSPACWFPRYGSEDEAWQGRVHQYDRLPVGVAMPFDLVPYLCSEGHWHLGRTS